MDELDKSAREAFIVLLRLSLLINIHVQKELTILILGLLLRTNV